MTDIGEEKSGARRWLGCAWAIVSRPSAKWSLGVLTGGGFAAGILFWGAFNWSVELSNSQAFCISCHEMRANVYEEIKGTAHYTNRTGVRAVCADCHVPKEWTHKMARKIQASFNELPLHLIGALDTPEKFEAKRMDMAASVWKTMKTSDSRECRNCHALESMNVEKQVRPAQRRHAAARTENKTCIDCHQGVAHKLPKDWEKTYQRVTGVTPP
ncbi:MAG: Denitrification system component NirT [Alphaproteobacteria bacterium]|nr:Denitrification system component NirT [Alphaproteobacteria bacterium]